ncbi:ABC transporter substrate-binding protein [Paralcaligenes ureilyticus]|uniref:Amino acid/amide ABC transporter substrate-binding protein (HAAT family) n=1 Tax=Paralcaligenes ureilyticus TaxID=627131 RepID=A0A4R3MDZ1_9BURK|nr:ABC transporter substrate-binding protein [Paralcaligenes ureilyticus]TCT09765.1 amino acid/amide ABC transporter substrate-binding protein (HAAT family) [Paralcaligenes ureilyticus]
MDDKDSSKSINRRTVLKMAATAGAAALVSPRVVMATGEQPVKFGVDNPLTGTYAITGKNELSGMELAVEEINAKGGILGRPAQLIVEDSTSGDAGVAVQKAHKLIDRDKVHFLIGNVNSGLTEAISQVAYAKGVFMMDPGGHADPITGTECHWNVFQTDPSTTLLVNAIAPNLIKRFGKRFYFLVPDYAFGLGLLKAYRENLKKYNATDLGADLIPLGTTDYSSYLIKAQAAKPDVIIILQNGQDQTNVLKQAVQFGLDKRFQIAGANIELETLEALSPASRIGNWVIEWYWNQPNVPHVKEFVEAIKKKTGRVPTARTWFGHTSIRACALAANNAKSLDAVKMARALDGLTLPPDVALQPHPATYRANQHLLIGTLWAGHAQAAGSAPDDLFHIDAVIDSKTIAPTIEEAGCKMTWPA